MLYREYQDGELKYDCVEDEVYKNICGKVKPILVENKLTIPQIRTIFDQMIYEFVKETYVK